MRIKKVTLHGVGPFEHQEIEFREGKNPDLADVTLLVGENGTGKSTVLYAIAGAVGRTSHVAGGHAVVPRMRRRDAYVDVDMGDRRFGVKNSTWGALDAWVPNSGSSASASPVQWHAAPDDQHGWMAFAYAGMRVVGNVVIETIARASARPLEDALSFTNTSDTTRFAQWLANTNYSRLLATNAAAPSAERYSTAIRRCEAALTEVLGEPIGFDFPTEDLTPRVRMRGESLSFEVLPDGLKSVLSWVTDLLMRHDQLSWVDNLPIEQREFLLLLDEIDVHLHSAWQRRVLPLAQRLFPKAQIIATTHSPLVVASADDAHVVVLRRNEKGQPTVENLDSQIGSSYSAVLRSVFGIESEFDKDTQDQLDKLHAIKRELLARTRADRAEFDQLATALAGRSEELSQIVSYEKRQLDRQLKGAN